LAGDGSLYEIVNALLCRDPAGRPAFHEIAQALDAAAANTPPEVAAAPAPPLAPPSPGPLAGRDEGGAVRADRRARASLILTAVAGLALVAVAVAVFVPGTGHPAQTPPAPDRSSPAPARSSPVPAPSSPGLAGPPAPPPVGQQFRVAAAANPDGSPEVVARAPDG